MRGRGIRQLLKFEAVIKIYCSTVHSSVCDCLELLRKVNEARKEGKQLKDICDFCKFRAVISQTIGWKFKEIFVSKRKKKNNNPNLKNLKKT